MRSTALAGGRGSPKTLRVSSRLLAETISPWLLRRRRRSASCLEDLGSAQSMRRSFIVAILVSPTDRAPWARGSVGRGAAARLADATRAVVRAFVMVELYGGRGAFASSRF